MDYEADRQTREVYRYFQPENPAALNATLLQFDEHVGSIADFSRVTTPFLLDASDSETSFVERSSPSSPNTTLTSFAQLAALRLNAQRAFITVLNTDSQFILAEATRNSNLKSSKSSVGEGDRLFAGTTTLSDTWNICQETVAIDPDNEDGLYSFMVVNDLQQEERFRDLPFVAQEPHSRFYAATPLTSESGINLGCLFVLDPEPRQGLSDTEKDTLGRVAELVMDYLMVSRQAAEGRRASRLSRGLHLFVDGNSSFPSNARMSSRSNSSAHSAHSAQSLSPRGSPHLRASRSTGSQTNELEFPSPRSAPGNGSQNGNPRPLSPISNQNDVPVPPSPTPSLQSSRYGESNSEDSSSSNRWLFQRAANLLRQSLDLDGAGGVMFMEASDNSSEYVAAGHCDSTQSTNPAPILALSTRGDPFSYQASSTLSDPAVNLDNIFLKQLTHRYPKGKLWSFHHDGTFSTSEDQLIDESRKQRKKSKASETSKLNKFFPDASEVMFVPLWNATDSQWFAGCFCWTPQPTRVFSPAVDLSSVFAFGSSIMTEYSRVESVIADRQKGDFISSISHELRSPLHGVLAAAEFFGSTSLDQFQETLLDTINACGRTLLDTMNQVLDFSKIMSLERHKKALKHGKDPWKPKISEDTVTRLDTLVLTDVALLTEDVIDSVCLGHSHMQRSAISTNHHTDSYSTSSSNSANGGSQVDSVPQVEVIVDIPDNDWMYKVQPGSLRRLIMNILGNALKYTKKGRISICMEATERSKGRSRRQGLEDMVTLTISDTGKGISKEYLRKHLFTPFSQEDPLSVGTGLGLSIVRGIVKTLNGKINVRSRQGEGTIVKVSLPLERLVGDESPQSTSRMEDSDHNRLAPSSQLRRVDCSGKRAAIWGIDPSDISEHPFWASIARYITDWYGLKLVPVSANEPVDIMFVNERDLSAKEMQNFPAALPSLLIICSQTSNHGDARAQWSHLADSLTILHRPCGPRKLSRAILSCLYAKPTQPTSNPQNLQEGLVLSERPALTVSPLPVEDPNPSSPGNLRSPAPEPQILTPESSNETINRTERSDSALTSRTDSSARTLSGSTDSTNPTSSSSARPSSRDLGQISTSSGSEGRPRVLVVDDNNINLHLMMTFMEKRKVVVLGRAENGRAAVDAFEMMPQGYDIVFMDMSMPVMDGFEATRAIRAIEKERDGCIPATIIALTGLSSSLDERRALDSGVDLFLMKPVSFKEVSRLIDEWEAKPPNKTWR
ncbi:CheY-like superfamily [Penicillium concentricum]|uniref:CheY-like superfamily n=1 Tax=Penicillium concentricum TaxID=293559 RepID=A0A9W9RJL9_9EURO|nr:CheY-like superfamily [Penicillium concentricum]KAJ5360765.1 CheY-like superfamily [Penicillium concentricum]